jgi:predicted nucleotidyltransferase
MKPKAPILRAAEQVADILKQQQVEAVVIGAVALAAHNYVRHTRDIDLGVSTDPATLRRVLNALREAGFTAELHEPDGADPLGGVIDISGNFGLLQIVNFGGRFPVVIEDALRSATMVVRPGSSLKLVPLPQLVALKLYAGGVKSKADILELLRRNPDADLDIIRATCKRYRLKGLDETLADLTRLLQNPPKRRPSGLHTGGFCRNF